MKKLLFALLVVGSPLWAADFQAGMAKIKITPPTPFWMSGYGGRTNQSIGVLQDLWARALALRDAKGHRIVIVTTDLIGLHPGVSDPVFARARKQFKLDRADLLLCCSHTHSGPVVGMNLNVMFDFSADEKRRVLDYSAQLTDNIVKAIGDALNDLSPAHLATGNGSVGFAINRRQRTDSGNIVLGVNPTGPVDHDVPVLKVTSPDGKLRAILFGYACHCTTISTKGKDPSDFYRIHGDYAGQAEEELEKRHPGAVAMFTILCGADQNPNPRGSLELAVEHGQALAAEVNRVLDTGLRAVRGPIRTACQIIQLDFAPHTRQTFEDEIKNSQDPKRPNKFLARRARMMLDAYDKGKPIRQTPYPVQAIRFGNDLSIIALGGEVVVDYQLRAKREFPGENLMAVGFANDVMCYIPTARVLGEGGYEAEFSMVYYGQPGPFAETVEEKVFRAIRSVMAKAGAR
ncbi:MAG: hypothetical protein FJ395_17940 [Verrucomicrobia bacterium]|nr:hypothetical protein [Verrucomicrobiota bacterium]